MNRKDQDTGSTTLDLSLGDERTTPKGETMQKRKLGNSNLEVSASPKLYGNERWLRSGKRERRK